MLKKLQQFFYTDKKIKEKMIRMAPTNLDKYIDEETIKKYTDVVNDSLKYIFDELKSIAVLIFGKESNVYKRISDRESETMDNFYKCGFDIEKLKHFYREHVSNMELDFINSVKRECVGYSFGGSSSVAKASTINELLHFLHSYITNNENIFEVIPLVDEKQNDYEYPLYLRGVISPVFKSLFDHFPLDLDCGYTDFVGVSEDKLLMMVRDRGHALSIEITLKDKVVRLEYFVPKLCNMEMINNLPGINKVTAESIGATGVFEVPIENLQEELYRFISMVPTDMDMVLDYNKKM